jgi:hypothetical protein
MLYIVISLVNRSALEANYPAMMNNHTAQMSLPTYRRTGDAGGGSGSSRSFAVYFNARLPLRPASTRSLKTTIFSCGRLHSGQLGGIQLITILSASNPTTIAVL